MLLEACGHLARLFHQGERRFHGRQVERRFLGIASLSSGTLRSSWTLLSVVVTWWLLVVIG